MALAPLLDINPAIQLHVAAAVLALVLGTVVLLMEKGTPIHKAMGRTWIGLMLVVSLTSFFITEIRLLGPYSPIHVLSFLTLFGLYAGWRAARAGDIRDHRITMMAVYFAGLIGAGLFTLLPGRIMHAVVFADGGAAALVSALAVGAVLVAVRYRGRASS